MTDKDLRKLSRADLLELLVEQRRENEQLRCLLDQTQAKLTDRTIQIDNAGSIADAALQINGVFEAAQATCQHYIENIALLNARQETLCRQKELETTLKCEAMIAAAELQAQQHWDACHARLQQFVASVEGLQQIMELCSGMEKPAEKSGSAGISLGSGQITGTLY